MGKTRTLRGVRENSFNFCRAYIELEYSVCGGNHHYINTITISSILVGFINRSATYLRQMKTVNHRVRITKYIYQWNKARYVLNPTNVYLQTRDRDTCCFNLYIYNLQYICVFMCWVKDQRSNEVISGKYRKAIR